MSVYTARSGAVSTTGLVKRNVMTRKSQELRLQEGRILKAKYDDGNLETIWEYSFLVSMISQMEAGRYPSKRQRVRFDAMIEEGVPEPKGDKKLLAEIDTTIKHWAANPDRLWDLGVLRGIRRNVFNDWKLSDKQHMMNRSTI